MPARLVLVAVVVVGFLGSSARAAEREIRLATSATVRDSGVLEALLPEFTKESGLAVRVIAASPAAALALCAEGAADVVLADAPEVESKLLASRVLQDRTPLLEDYFLIAGPPDDPARVREASDGADALRRIAAAKAPYLSLGRDTAAHVRERALLAAAGLDPERGWPGFVRSDATPIETVRQAGAKFPGRIDGPGARTLYDWLLRPSTSEKIASFGVKKWGEPFFRPLHAGED